MIFTPPSSHVVDRNGQPLARAKLSFFAGSTQTPLVVYRDAALTAPIGSTVTADLAGRFPAVFLPVATAAATTYRVRCADSMDGTIYEASGLDLPVVTAADATAPSTYALTLIPSAEDNGALVITLTSATFQGLLSVNASSADVQVVLPTLSSLSPGGRNMTIRQIGSGAAVVVYSTIAAILIDGSQGFPLSEPNEQITLVAGATDFKAIDWTHDGHVLLVQSRQAAPVTGPVTGGYYIATATSTPWIVQTVYRANGVGGWRTITPRTGMTAMVLDESYAGLRVPYQYNGSAWTPWPGFASSTSVVTYRSALVSTAVFPPTAKTADFIIDDVSAPVSVWLWDATPLPGAYVPFSAVPIDGNSVGTYVTVLATLNTLPVPGSNYTRAQLEAYPYGFVLPTSAPPGSIWQSRGSWTFGASTGSGGSSSTVAMGLVTLQRVQ